MGSISHHIMPLVIHSLGDKDTHTCKHAYRHLWTEAILRNQACTNLVQKGNRDRKSKNYANKLMIKKPQKQDGAQWQLQNKSSFAIPILTLANHWVPSCFYGFLIINLFAQLFDFRSLFLFLKLQIFQVFEVFHAHLVGCRAAATLVTSYIQYYMQVWQLCSQLFDFLESKQAVAINSP